MYKKILSLILTLSMALGLFAALPLTVHAADYVCRIGSTYYGDLHDALMVVPKNGTMTTITLVRNIDYGGAIELDNQKITLDLQGYFTLYIHNAGTFGGYGIIANNGSELALANVGTGAFNLNVINCGIINTAGFFRVRNLRRRNFRCVRRYERRLGFLTG